MPGGQRLCQQNLSAPQDVDRREDDRTDEGVADSTWPEAGQVDQAIGQSIGCIEEEDKEPPPAELDEAIAHGDVEQRGDRFC